MEELRFTMDGPGTVNRSLCHQSVLPDKLDSKLAILRPTPYMATPESRDEWIAVNKSPAKHFTPT